MGNILYNNIVIESAEELVPFISIASLNRKELCVNLLDKTPQIDNYLAERFGDKYEFCPKAREGIVIVLKELNLKPDDVVTILTTTGNPYISGCVTKAIEKVCKWSREFTPMTKAIFVNHEFGYAYENVYALKEYNIPIIEDCAHSFFTKSPDIGTVGDYVIYSLPKGFSMQLGGIIVYRDQLKYKCPDQIVRYIKSALEPQIGEVSLFVKKRFYNYNYYLNALRDMGIYPYFKQKEGDVPGVFMFVWPECRNYRGLKTFLNENGVDSSVFFGQDAYYIPVHHNLSTNEMDYICSLIRYFKENLNSEL